MIRPQVPEYSRPFQLNLFRTVGGKPMCDVIVDNDVSFSFWGQIPVYVLCFIRHSSRGSGVNDLISLFLFVWAYFLFLQEQIKGIIIMCVEVCVLLLQDLLQSCSRGGRRRVEDMCYERRRRVCVLLLQDLLQSCARGTFAFFFCVQSPGSLRASGLIYSGLDADNFLLEVERGGRGSENIARAGGA
jgi:hypothetical protein